VFVPNEKRPALKIFPQPKLLSKVKKIKEKRKKLVFTNGCFDLLHAGHIKLIEKAKSCGDYLIVALNSNASVRRIKGPRRPLVTLNDRMRVVAALESVDFVTWFSEDTPLKAIKLIKPDVLVKGGDWTKKDIVGKDDVKKVVRIKLKKGDSTSSLIKNILKRYGNR